MKNNFSKLTSILMISLVVLGNSNCKNMAEASNMDSLENAGILSNTSSQETGEPRISSHVAILIAEGLIATRHVDLNLYRAEAQIDNRKRWKVEFILKERYRHFNVRCAEVYIDSNTGEVEQVGFPVCSTPPLMEHATKAKHYSLPGGSIGVHVDEERASAFEIYPWEWEALFWDELGATDPNYAPGWEKTFGDSIPNYPTLSKIRGEVGSKVTFEGDEIAALMKECIQIVESAKNPIALNVVKKILTACELAKQKKASVHFVGD